MYHVCGGLLAFIPIGLETIYLRPTGDTLGSFRLGALEKREGREKEIKKGRPFASPPLKRQHFERSDFKVHLVGLLIFGRLFTC